MIVTPVPIELSQPAQGNPVQGQQQQQKHPPNPCAIFRMKELPKGRCKNSHELFLSTKLSIIKYSISERYLENPRPGVFRKITAKQFIDFSSSGDIIKKRSVKQVRDWAVQSTNEGWEQFAADKEMQALYGPNPLANFRRVPDVWCRKFGIISRKKRPLASVVDEERSV